MSKSTESKSLNAFFNPKGIALIGASYDPVKLGYGLARNLIQSGYPGEVYFVNPKPGEILGKIVYSKISELPDPVDMGILLVPAKYVPESLEECGKRGIKAIVICSGGFRETGTDGLKLEEECKKVAAKYNLRMIGPNCIGIIDMHLPMNGTFLPPPGPQGGEIAFISHSGAICAAVIDWSFGMGFGLSRLVSLGNQIDVNETELLELAAKDKMTKVITLYLEGISDGRKFLETAQKVSAIKPVIALKVGRSESGKKAVASHTGALAGLEQAYDAAFRKAGIIRAESSEDLFDWARTLAWCSVPRGNRVAILTNAGGPGVTASDTLEAAGMQLPELSPQTIEKLKPLLIDAASLKNPVDMLASATPELYAACLEIILNDPNIDLAMVITPPPPVSSAGAVARAIIPIIQGSKKPVVMVLMGERMVAEGREHLRANKVPDFRYPERAATALAVLAHRSRHLNRERGYIEQYSDVDLEKSKKILANSTPDKNSFLSSKNVNAIIEATGIRVVNQHLAQTAQQAVEMAQQTGFPIVMKIESKQVVHKSEAGGVKLNLTNTAEVELSFNDMMEKVKLYNPEAKIDGVQIQPMLVDGQEVIIGFKRDPQFGPLMMFGSGGVEVEGLKDIQFGLIPLSAQEARDMIEKTWAGKKLDGFRNIQAADKEIVLQYLLKLALLAENVEEILEMEINPLYVLPKSKGAYAVDARIKVKK